MSKTNAQQQELIDKRTQLDSAQGITANNARVVIGTTNNGRTPFSMKFPNVAALNQWLTGGASDGLVIHQIVAATWP